MSRIIAIDYGLKRTGLATSDSLQKIAFPLKTVLTQELISFLREYILKESVTDLVLGFPKHLNNEDTDATLHVRVLYKQLCRIFSDKRIHLVDERFTSKMAIDTMVRGGMKKSKRRDKKNIDTISATIILQSFLEKERFLR